MSRDPTGAEISERLTRSSAVERAARLRRAPVASAPGVAPPSMMKERARRGRAKAGPEPQGSRQGRPSR